MGFVGRGERIGESGLACLTQKRFDRKGAESTNMGGSHLEQRCPKVMPRIIF